MLMHMRAACGKLASVSQNSSLIDAYHGTNTATIGTHQTSDFFIVCATRDGSSTAPVLPAGWTQIASGGTNALGYVLAFKIAASASETAGTFTNATSTTIIHERPASGWTPSVGVYATGGSISVTNPSVPAATLQVTDGTSRGYAFYASMSSDITNLTTPPSDMEICGTSNQDATDTLAAYRTTSNISSWSAHTTTFGGTVSTSRCFFVEIRMTQTPEDTTPDAFTFTDQTGAALSTLTASNSVTITGINAAATVTVSGGEHNINGAGWSSSSSTVTTGQTIQVRHTSSGSNSTATNTTLTVGGVSDTFTTTTLAASGDWQLATGHYIPRKVAMRIVHPRPDADTNAYAAHRNAYPGMPYSTYVAVQGGSYPFYYELATAPSGMTIGGQLTVVGDIQVADSTYGRIYWANPTAGTHTVTVNVYDQNYNRGGDPSVLATVTFALVVSTSRFVFIHPTTGSDSNAGTIDAPFLTIEKLHADSSATTTYNGKIVVLRGGTHDLDGMSTNGNRYVMLSGGAPVVFQGYPGENAILNLYQGHFGVNTGAADMQFKDLTIQAAGDWTDDQYFFYGVTATNRHSWFNVTFTNFYGGTSTAGNNQSVLYYSNVGCNDISIMHCSYTGRMGSIADYYNIRYAVFAHNTGSNLNTTAETNGSNSHELIYLKDSCRDISIRANTFVTGMTNVSHGSFVGCGGQNNGGAAHSFNNIEICYNKLAMFANASLRGYYEYGAGPVGSVYGYRNSCLGDVEDFVDSHGNGPNPNVWENNVVVGGIANMFNATLTDNTTGASTLDSNANLTGATRTSYLGIRGAEVA